MTLVLKNVYIAHMKIGIIIASNCEKKSCSSNKNAVKYVSQGIDAELAMAQVWEEEVQLDSELFE